MAGERVFRYVNDVLEELAQRNPARRYKYRPHPDIPTELIYLEFTDAEEAARDAEEALPPPPFSGFGRCVAVRANQVIPNNTATAVSFGNAPRDIGDYFNEATPDRFTVGPAQGGAFDVKVGVRFNEASVGPGGAANAGDRVVQLRIGGSPVATARQRAAASGDTEIVFTAPEPEAAAGDLIRIFVAQNCGGTMSIDARVVIRRLGPADA